MDTRIEMLGWNRRLVDQLDTVVFVHVARCIVGPHVGKYLVAAPDQPRAEFVHVRLDTTKCARQTLHSNKRYTHLATADPGKQSVQGGNPNCACRLENPNGELCLVIASAVSGDDF